MIGQTIHNYVIRSQVGQGGWATVYMAEHPAIGRRVAIKVLREELAQREDTASRFFSEARAANAVRNPHITEVLDFGQLSNGVPYLIMEWLEGLTLREFLRRQS